MWNLHIKDFIHIFMDVLLKNCILKNYNFCYHQTHSWDHIPIDESILETGKNWRISCHYFEVIRSYLKPIFILAKSHNLWFMEEENEHDKWSVSRELKLKNWASVIVLAVHVTDNSSNPWQIYSLSTCTGSLLIIELEITPENHWRWSRNKHTKIVEPLTNFTCAYL